MVTDHPNAVAWPANLAWIISKLGNYIPCNPFFQTSSTTMKTQPSHTAMIGDGYGKAGNWPEFSVRG